MRHLACAVHVRLLQIRGRERDALAGPNPERVVVYIVDENRSHFVKELCKSVNMHSQTNFKTQLELEGHFFSPTSGPLLNIEERLVNQKWTNYSCFITRTGFSTYIFTDAIEAGCIRSIRRKIFYTGLLLGLITAASIGVML